MVDELIERAQLLPRSGVGVAAPWLVIAPPGNPVIRLDLRMLDRVAAWGDEEADRESGAAPRGNLMLVCGEVDACLYIADGVEAVERIVREASPLTRERAAASPPDSTLQPKTRSTSDEASAHGPDAAADVAPFLFVGDDAVLSRGDFIQVGRFAYRISEVRDYALQGANIPLGEGRLLQAALAMFVVAAAERHAESVIRVEDFWTERSGSGVGPPIVWLHGGPGLWDYLAPAAALTDALCVSYRYDQRGCGRTRAPGGASVAQNVADLEALRAHWGAERIIVAGHGWGASLALHYSLAHPDRVAGRVLVGSCGVIPGSHEAANEELRRRPDPERKARIEALAERLETEDAPEDERTFFEMLWALDCVDPASVGALFVDNLRINNPLHFSLDAADMRIMEAPDFVVRLREQRTPTLVVHGEHDSRPASAARELAGLLPAAELLLVPGAGHYPWLEAPDLLRSGLSGFIRRVTAETPSAS